tara:strand:+ start:1799 stop:2107 length:309 start_codon:yes stop_codon:yes gene_type:complete
MRDEFYYILRKCLLSRQDWAKYQCNYLRFKSLKEEAARRRLNSNLFLSITYNIINLPSTILNFIVKINEYSEYNRVLSEIEVLEEAINKYNKKQINTKRRII